MIGTWSWAEAPRARQRSRSRGHTPILPYMDKGIIGISQKQPPISFKSKIKDTKYKYVFLTEIKGLCDV